MARKKLKVFHNGLFIDYAEYKQKKRASNTLTDAEIKLDAVRAMNKKPKKRCCGKK